MRGDFELIKTAIAEILGVKKKPSQQPNKTRKGPVKKPANGQPDRRRILTRREEIPAHESVLSVEDGDIDISSALREHYAVLLESNESKRIIVAVSSKIPAGPIDNDFLYIKEQCQTKGYTAFKRIYVNPGILSIIYEEGTVKSKAQKKEDKSEMQGKVFDLLQQALDKKASDIHLEVRSNNAEIRFRINSKLVLISPVAIKEAEALAGLIYRVIAKEKEVTFNPRVQQSAIIDQDIAGTRVRIRLNTMPAYPGGFDMVMRVLRMGSSTGDATVSGLGYSDPQQADIRLMNAKPTGVIIVAGVTGSGKSTTNSVFLKDVIAREMVGASSSIKVITVEDPPEYEIKFATQFPVNSNGQLPGGKSPFAEAMKAALRCDPDILMVGEVRDQQSAELLQYAVQSGHRVYTTIHAQSGFSILSRLNGIGVPNSVLGSQGFISGLIYQTLIPVPCNHCSMTLEQYREDSSKTNEDEQEKQALLARISSLIARFGKDDIVFRNHQGCSKCATGIVGMTVVAETIVPDEEMVQLFSRGHHNEAMSRYRDRGGEFAVDHGIGKVLDGLICPIDAEDRLGPLVSTREVVEILRQRQAALPQDSISDQSVGGHGRDIDTSTETKTVDGFHPNDDVSYRSPDLRDFDTAPASVRSIHDHSSDRDSDSSE